ncbi:DUF2614 family zinc ribbon-containing protein [Marinicrinis sediminis]|uniref:DUF2614 family zinc ribbon-containing protein n=1 Tax=Marinicrinis sediminis TaxID=1652465 RepID=A0ABW5RBS0_9BACL
MKLKSSKINEFRLWGLLLTLAGMGVMIIGTAGVLLWGDKGKILMFVMMFFGSIFLMASMAVYFWAGMMSTSTVALECPNCGKQTKMIGKTDRCMYCKTILTVDPEYAPEKQSTPSETKEL